ncbi:uncharacterized protein LOC133724968 [Rosa rugosa]|uniref:uncharacterized protein LOC133724968 n=1 Tax=Rosa rugosa TaxID=74645 RepID=UPI002B407FC8|nr:uncharacterized protein LOC133724968 [Rosa rugosa]
MEIHHGGYFDKMPDGTKKYKVARFNKDGGKIWLDGLDPDLIAWTEFGNIAWDLGYREKPISYFYKMPRTYCNEGWMPIRNDADAVEMVKLIPLKTRQISVFITGGGRRRKKEAEEDDLRPKDPNWENPLNKLTAAERGKVEVEANIAGSKLNRPSVAGCGSSRVNVVGAGDVNARQEGVSHKAKAHVVINLDSESDLEASEGGRQQSHGTFTGLSELVPDLFASQSVGKAGNDNFGQGQRNKAEEQGELRGVYSGFYNKFIPRPREKHTVQKRWQGRLLPCVLAAEQQEPEAAQVQSAEPSEVEADPSQPQAKEAEAEPSEVEPSQPQAKEAAKEPSEVETDPSQPQAKEAAKEPSEVETDPSQPQAKEAEIEAESSQFQDAPPSQDFEDTPHGEDVIREEQPRVESGGQKGERPRAVSGEKKSKKQNKGVGKGKKVAESEKGKKVPEFEKENKQKFSEAEKGKKVGVDSGGAASKKKGRPTKEPRYKTRKSSSKVYEQVEDFDSSSEGSDFFIDSDFDPQDSEDDVEFEANVSNPTVVEEYEDMGFRGQCSDEGGETDEDLGSLQGSETEEDEEGNPLQIPTWRGIKLKSWNRRVDLKNPTFVVGHVFANNEVLKEAIRECGLVTRRGLWFQKNSKQKIEVKCQLGCPFWLYASNIAELGPSTLVIKTLKDEHNCSHLTHSHHLTYNRVAKEVQADLLVDEDWSRKGIQNHIQKKFNLDVSVQKVSRGKNKAKRMNEGHYIDQYNKLASYKKELLRSNPGSTVVIKTEMVGEVRRFHRMYVCLAACKKGWIEGCRPIIGLDGCHIKGHHPGQLLCERN